MASSSVQIGDGSAMGGAVASVYADRLTEIAALLD
jgi:hypothetical protein